MPSQGARPRSPIDAVISRRRVLAGMAGIAGVVAVPSLLAACGSPATPSPSASTSSPSASGSAGPSPSPTASASPGASFAGTVHVGSYHKAAGESDGQKAVDTAFTDATGIQVAENLVDRSAFEAAISTYLAGTPDTAFTWSAGFRMRSLADKGLIVAIPDVWDSVKANFSDPFAQAVTGNDGKVYGVPVGFAPWLVFYRKSLFAEKGYQVPATWADLKTLCGKMQADGLTPIAFADQEGWPAFGTFDLLDLRLNGFQFHVDLLAGKEKWTDAKVTAVFKKWAEIVPFQSKDFATRRWTDAAASLLDKKSGMYLFDLRVPGVFAASKTAGDSSDLDLFAFPKLGTSFDDEAALDVAADTWHLAAKSADLAREQDAAKAYLEFWARGSTQGLMAKTAPSFLPTAKDADTSSYSDLQKKVLTVVGTATHVSQFLDRDTRPDFAAPQGMPAFLQRFLADPSQDLVAFQKSIQDFWDGLPALS